ncbi:PREDICTED: tumor necrosis factor alpha-induced protein 2 [Myotis brandtii]|uniref:tumor necrosis factor alpha-induced protein 2 n=1 Tax=Myotis brandtii TaxID=109478 RepID=UPI0007047141|nr:PREDICTED: tumor necrosis factor alpha-induced protein 2 [Myotis brandtii]
MLQTMTFQGLPGQQRVPGALDFPGSPLKFRSASEAESEASMSEASSEDPVPLPEAEVAQDEEEASKKKKKPKGLAGMFSIFTKGKKKKGQSGAAEREGKPEAKPEAKPGRGGSTQVGWGRVGEGPGSELAGAWLTRPGPRGQNGGLARLSLLLPPAPLPNFRVWEEANQASVLSGTPTGSPGASLRDGGLPGSSESRSRLGHGKIPRIHHLRWRGREGGRLSPQDGAGWGRLPHASPSAHSDIINSASLAGELQGINLGSLLPPKQVRLLEATFLSNEVASVKELMARALDLESQRWAQDVAPQRLNGHCHSELAIDIFSLPPSLQIVSQGQVKAESIMPDLGKQIQHMLLAELAAFLRSYQRAFEDFLERCKQLRNYRANVMANINNCLSFRISLEKWQAPQGLLGPLNELKSHGFDTLLQGLFWDLKPLFKRFTQTRWAASAQTLEEIVSTVETRLPEFSELRECFQEELMELVHLHLVKEYIVRLCKRRVVLKTAEQQQQLAGQVLANAEVIQHFCTQIGSPATWLHYAVPTLAEIIRLQDPSAIKIEVATYATWYPDFSKGHLSAILAIKGNLSSSEVKSIRSILDVHTGAPEAANALFSLIKVG